MATPLRIDTRDPRPIWRQIEEGLVQLIGSGRFAEGEAVPSVRDLARELRVNPNTVAKAYQQLADQGVVEMRRGEGTFVAASKPLRAADRRARLVESAARLASVAATLGAEREESHEALDEACNRLARGSKEKP